jgi:hypothetical protein
LAIAQSKFRRCSQHDLTARRYYKGDQPQQWQDGNRKGRGSYRVGRVIDVAPKVADKLDMRQAGVAPVTVVPIAAQQPDGAVKLAAGAAEVSPEEVAEAAKTTKAATTPARSAADYLKR